MSGQPIRSVGDVDPAAVESLGDRMAVLSERRGPVIGLALLVWLLGLAVSAVALGSSAARGAVRVVGLSVVYLPLVLLIGAAIEPSEGVEIALTTILSPLLALITLRLIGGYRALAVASGATVLATAIDVIAGSPLTALSLLGPNPGLGVRFYGIGNELEALLAVLVVAGTGAGPGRLRPATGALPRGRLLPDGRARPARSSSPSAASGRMSGRRSCCRSAPLWRPRRSAPEDCVRASSSLPPRSRPLPCSP